MKDIAQMDYKKIWQVTLKHRYLFIAVSLLCLSIIFWGSFFMPKIYEAKSTVFVQSNIIKQLVKGIVVTPSIEERLRVLRFEMMSRNMLLKVIDALDLDLNVKNQEDMELMVKNFQEKTKIRVKGNDLFIVSFRGKNPQMVRDYVNTLVSQYIEENTSSKREEAFSANQFLSEQINYYKKKLEESEERLVRFRREKKIYLAANENLLVQTIRKYKEETENVEMEIEKLEAKKAKIKQQLSGEEPLTLAMVSKEGKENLSARLKMLQESLPLLLTKYTENYPEVIKTRAEIETIKEQIEAQRQNQKPVKVQDSKLGFGTSIMNPVYQQLKEELFRTESEIDSLKAKANTLNNRIKKSETELRDIPEDKKELADLERDRNTYQGIYNQLLARLGQAEVSEQMEIQDKGTNFRIVDPAILPTRPVSPDRVKFFLFGIFAGVAAGIGAVLLREYLDNSIKDIDTLKSHLGLQVLAVIPRIVTNSDIEKKRRLDRRVYTVSIIYLSIIGSLFLKELINRFL